MVDPVPVGVVDEEVAEEAVEDEDEADVEDEVGHVAEAVLRPDPVPAPPVDGKKKKNRNPASACKFLFRHDDCFKFRPMLRPSKCYSSALLANFIPPPPSP